MKTINRILLSFLGIMPMIASAAGESPYHAIVAADGSGDYRTVSEAIAAAPEGRTSPWRILVKSGDYDEFVVIPESKPFIHLIGQGKNSTAIRHKLNQGSRNMEAGRFANSTFWDYSCNNPEVDSPRKTSAVVWVNAPDFYTEGISYINDWGREAWSGPQALAFYGNADRHALKDCALISFQ
ncbi:MAG: pectin esterase, partial [Duncaniella sp.]|nr:pectin esterase [Duncaniella sp.]